MDVPPQGRTSFVFVARAEDGEAVVVKRASGALAVGPLEREASVLAALAGGPLPVARCLGLVHDGDAAWLVTTYLPGATLWHRLRDAPPEDPRRVAWMQALGDLLARIHTTPVPPALEDRPSTPWLDAQVRRRAELAPEEPSKWLEERLAAAPEIPVVRCLVHGDFTLDNVIVDDTDVVGVIDLGAMGRGDPDYDFALALLPEPGVELSGADVAAFFRGYRSADLPVALRAHVEALWGATRR
jgi:aminoglycoside 3'-phosphotransferase-2